MQDSKVNGFVAVCIMASMACTSLTLYMGYTASKEMREQSEQLDAIITRVMGESTALDELKLSLEELGSIQWELEQFERELELRNRKIQCTALPYEEWAACNLLVASEYERDA